jgi:nucleoside-diphosphate-sugar epimerase
MKPRLFLLLAVLLQVMDGFQHFFGGKAMHHRMKVNFAMTSKYLGKDPVFIAGGSSGIGLEIIKKLSAMGTPVKVLVRRDSARDYLRKLPGVTVLMGDALDEAAVQNCMKGCVAAITTLGGQPQEGQPVRVDYAGNSNVIEQAGILGVERIILVTR